MFFRPGPEREVAGFADPAGQLAVDAGLRADEDVVGPAVRAHRHRHRPRGFQRPPQPQRDGEVRVGTLGFAPHRRQRRAGEQPAFAEVDLRPEDADPGVRVFRQDVRRMYALYGLEGGDEA